MPKIVTLSFDVPVERMGLFVDLLMDEGIQARITYPTSVPEPKKASATGITRHVDRKQPMGARVYAILAEDRGTSANVLMKHLTSIGYNPSSASSVMSLLKERGFAIRKEDNLWYRTKKPFKVEEIKIRHTPKKKT